MAGGLLTKKALVLAKVEVTPGVDAAPTTAADSILVSDPQYTTDPQVLERDFVSNDLSSFEHIIGRVVAGFQFVVDFRGNGLSQSGLLADQPKLATLMEGCGYKMFPMDGTGDEIVGNQSELILDRDNPVTTSDLVWTHEGTVTLLRPVLYTMEVITPGATAVATILTTGNNDAEDDLSAASPIVVVTGAPISLGAKGGTVTPTWTGDLAAGDKFYVLAFPTGVKARPTSTEVSTLTIYMYRDGLLFKGFNGIGTFTVEAPAGDFAKVTFNFTTDFQAVTDVTLPTDPVYETTKPPQVELSLLTWGDNVETISDSWAFDAGNDVQVRLDVNAPQGYIGSRIADRAPSCGFNPEATLEATEPFWADFFAAKSKVFTVVNGTTVGNQIVVWAPTAQPSEQAFSDRNGIMAYDKTMLLRRGNLGDDEVSFVFA